MNETKRRAFLPTLLALFLPALSGCGGDSVEPAADLVRPIRAVKVGDTEVFARNWLPGRAKAAQEVNLSFDVPGQLIEFPIDVGDELEKGDLVGALDPRDYKNGLDAAKAQVEQARALLERVEKAAESGAVSQQEVTDARARFDVAEANVQIKQKALDDTRISSPLKGSVAATYVENYQNVNAKQAVARILDISRVEMKVDVPESAISLLPYVSNVRCRFEAFPGIEVAAEISEVGTEADLSTRTYPITLVMDQPEGRVILPGMAGEATGDVNPPGDLEDEGFEIPLSAVARAQDGSSIVWIVDESSKTVSRRVVELGELTGRGVRVTGIRLGEWVATAGANTLREGQEVRLPGETAQ